MFLKPFVRSVRNIASYMLVDVRLLWSELLASQRSLQNESIFRLLLKVAVIRVHQCESILIFCGVLTPILYIKIELMVGDEAIFGLFSFGDERHSAAPMQNDSVHHTPMHQVTYLAGVGRGSRSSFS